MTSCVFPSVDAVRVHVTCSPTQAYMRRFPKCPLIPVFVDSEVVGEHQSDGGAVSVTERRCVIDIDAPRLLKRVHFLRLHHCADSQVNPVTRVTKGESFPPVCRSQVSITCTSPKRTR